MIEGLDKVVAALETEAARPDRQAGRVAVGYTQSYAIYVHENMEARHRVGNAKYLEGPLRRLSDDIGEIVRDGIQRGIRTGLALLRAGLFLQAASQKECPVDKGLLRASAFTKEE